jgi:hypothetical protein
LGYLRAIGIASLRRLSEASPAEALVERYLEVL